MLKAENLEITTASKEEETKLMVVFQAAIRKEPELKHLVYQKDYFDVDISTINHYLMMKKEKHPYDLKPVFKTKPYIAIVFQETPESLEYQFQQKIIKNHDWFHQDLNLNKLKEISLETFKTKFVNQIPIIKKYWSDFENFQKKPSLYLYGDFDTGKTYFFKLIMRYFYYQQEEFLFLFLPDLPRQFKQGWFDNELKAKMNLLRTVPYLFLDDLGSENLTIYFRDDILFPLLNARHENGLITFISSNLNFQQLIDHFKIIKDEKQSWKAFKTVNKLKNMCQFYCFDTAAPANKLLNN